MDSYRRAIIAGLIKDTFKSPSVMLTLLALVVVVLGFIALGRKSESVVPKGASVHITASTSTRTIPTSTGPAVDLAIPVIKDEQETLWTLELKRGQSIYRIQKSGKSPGPPYRVGANLRREGPGFYSIGLDMVGQAGEYYSGQVLKNGQALHAPGFDVVDRKGRTLFSSTFEYG